MWRAGTAVGQLWDGKIRKLFSRKGKSVKVGEMLERIPQGSPSMWGEMLKRIPLGCVTWGETLNAFRLGCVKAGGKMRGRFSAGSVLWGGIFVNYIPRDDAGRVELDGFFCSVTCGRPPITANIE